MPISGYFDQIFAAAGDLTVVPDPAQGDGSVSYAQGYPIAYSTEVGSGGKNIERSKMNQILNDITTAIQKYQQTGTPPFITTAMNGGTPYSYAYGSRALYNGVCYTSLKPANVDLPSVAASWRADLSSPPGLVGSFKNLSFIWASTTTANFTVDEAFVETALGGIVFKGVSLSEALNISTTGAGGMDVGSANANSPLFIYLIYNPTTNDFALLATVSGSGANIYPGANMPAGYIASAKICSLVCNGTAHLPPFAQLNGQVYLRSPQVLTAGNSTTLAGGGLNLAAVIAADAKGVVGYGITNTAAATFDVAGDVNGIGRQRATPAGTGGVANFGEIPVIAGTSINYLVTTGTLDLFISSYRLW